jgi:CheY-like chemotaxis protein
MAETDASGASIDRARPESPYRLTVRSRRLRLRFGVLMRVLVVDDEADVTLVLGEALRDRGHVVAVASSGREAIETASSFQPDAALVDVGLPDIDGVTLAELLRGTSSKPVRVIGFSGYAEKRIRAAVRSDVFDGFLLKPATLETIERALKAA